MDCVLPSHPLVVRAQQLGELCYTVEEVCERERQRQKERKKFLKTTQNARLDLQPMLRHVVLKKFKNNKMGKKESKKGGGKRKKKKKRKEENTGREKIEEFLMIEIKGLNLQHLAWLS